MSERLNTADVNQLVLDILNDAVESHTDPDDQPFEVSFNKPLPSRVRFYLYGLGIADEPHGYTINVRLENVDDEGHIVTDRSDDNLVIIGGYDKDYDVFTFWDDDLYYDYGAEESQPYTPYVKEETLEEAANNGLATQKRDHRERGKGGETVIAATPENLSDAIRMRARLLQIRRLLNEQLPDGWREESPTRGQQIERLVDVFLLQTNSDRPTHERRETAQEIVAESQEIRAQTIRRKLGRELWDQDKPEEGFKRGLFDPVLENIEAELTGEGPIHSYTEGDQEERKPNWTEPVLLDDIDDLPELDGLFFAQDETAQRSIIEQIDIALRSGKHVILTGPPGSGKTALATTICDHYAKSYEIATATDDWSTFDTIGGYRPTSDDDLEFYPGIFLQRFMNPDELEAKNEWLVVDELNRADIDKAFGSLFSALTKNNVTLPFEDEDKNAIKLIGDPDSLEMTPIDVDRYYIPEDWRMVATINSADKASLYRMSYAFMRRFAFIPVPVPGTDLLQSEGEDLISEYIDCWEIDIPENGAIDVIDGDLEDRLCTDIYLIWDAVQSHQEIGPGIIKDVVEHVVTGINETGNLSYESAVVAHVLPQLEGLSVGKLNEVLDDMARVPSFEREHADRFSRSYLGKDTNAE
jgi:energy-coupling factor transporter ATP-binding protein EcfA2